MTEAERMAWCGHAVLAMNAAFADLEYAIWPLCELLCCHMRPQLQGAGLGRTVASLHQID